MTDPKLREARIARAKELATISTPPHAYGVPVHHDAALSYLADLIEQDWRPEPEIDAVEAAFNDWRDKTGGWDVLDAFRAGHAHALRTMEGGQ